MQQQESIGKWISALYRYLQMRLNSELEPYNLGSGQFPVLLVLLKNEDVNQETISKTLHLDKATIARAVNKLMAKGYVVRKRDPLDGRAYVLYTTANGKKIAPNINKVLSRTSSLLLSDFTKQEKQMALKLLKKMYQNITTIETN